MREEGCGSVGSSNIPPPSGGTGKRKGKKETWLDNEIVHGVGG